MTPEMKEHLKNLALSGAISGSILGAGGKAISGARKLSEIAKAGLVGGGISSLMTAGGGGLGMALMGTPDDSDPDPTAFTKRSALGGALVGGLSGAALMSPSVRAAVVRAAKALGAENKLASLTKSRDSERVSNVVLEKLKGAKGTKGLLAGGTIGAAIGGYQGGDEGMQADFTRNLTNHSKDLDVSELDGSLDPETKAKLLQRMLNRGV
jgi:hypothetical protein